MSDRSEDEKAVTAHECASLLEVAASSIYRGVRQGVIPCLRIGTSGRSIRFIPSEVRAALRTRPAWVDPASHKRGKKMETDSDV
jgi:predicted DNA-binding transcriptional regulator AlpA